MDIKVEIKEEVPFPEVISQTERENILENSRIKLTSDAATCSKVCEVQTKTEIKEETVESDVRLQNDWGFLSENIVTNVNESNKNCKMDTKLEVKEELWWQQTTSTETPCTDDVTKDLTDKCWPSVESTRLRGEHLSTDNPVLFSDEDSEKHERSIVTVCERDRNCNSKEIDLSRAEKNVCSEQQYNAKDIEASSLKQYRTKEVDKSFKLSCEYKCSMCEKTFLSPSGLRRHKKFHHEGRKPHKCSICEKSFAELSDLKVHKLIHAGQKPHKCDICGNSFTQLTNLRTHKLIHEGKKPHKCDTCEKSFTRMTDLRRHKLIHEGIRPHKCEICGNSFTHLSTLKTHKMIHEGKKTLKCKICGNGYTQLPSFLRHKLIHENRKVHK